MEKDQSKASTMEVQQSQNSLSQRVAIIEEQVVYRKTRGVNRQAEEVKQRGEDDLEDMEILTDEEVHSMSESESEPLGLT